MAEKNTTFPDPKTRPPTLLVVEDEALLRAALADYLRDCGFKVYEASNGAEAIDIIEAKAMVIDLVLSDIEMPGKVDGFALAKWIRANRPKLPIVLAGSDSKKTKAADELCAKEPFFAKPYSLKRIVVFIRNRIQSKGRPTRR